MEFIIHTLHNKKVVHYVELLCPLQLETCIRSMLYKYRFKNNKDFFKCSLTKIIKAFDECMKSIKCVENHTGGNINNDNTFLYKITYYEQKLNQIYNIINLSTIV